MDSKYIAENEVIDTHNLSNKVEKDDKCDKELITGKQRKKCKKPNVEKEEFIFTIPLYSEFDYVMDKRLKISNLKDICRYYKLKVGGNKDELRQRLFKYLKNSYYICNVQCIIRRLLVKEWVECHGPALYDRNLPINTTDIGTLDDIDSIELDQVFSFYDKNGVSCYMFDVVSFTQIIKQMFIQKNKKQVSDLINPYTMCVIDVSVINQFIKLKKLSRILGRSVRYDMYKDNEVETPQQTIQQRILQLFQQIDAYGHYSDMNWLESLSDSRLRRFMREVIDIFNFRAGLSNAMKSIIIPPRGELFNNDSIRAWFVEHPERSDILDKAIFICEKLVFSGINTSGRELGSIYILMALTLCNESAREAMPWYYEAASTN